MDILSFKHFFTIGQIYNVLSSSKLYHTVKSWSNPHTRKQNKLNNILIRTLTWFSYIAYKFIQNVSKNNYRMQSQAGMAKIFFFLKQQIHTFQRKRVLNYKADGSLWIKGSGHCYQFLFILCNPVLILCKVCHQQYL